MNLTNSCRFCLLHKPILNPISWKLEENNVFLERITVCTNIKLSEANEDDLKSLICPDCAFKLLIFHEFKTQCLNNDRLYRENLHSQDLDLSQLNVKTEVDDAEQQDTFSKNPLEDVDYQDHHDDVDYESDKDFKSENEGQTPEDSSLQDQSNGETYSCDICSKKYKRREAMVKHMKKHADFKEVNDDYGETSYDCKDCLREFKSKETLTTHRLKYHSVTGEVVPFEKRLRECTVCKKTFTKHCNLVEHMRSHSDDRPFVCDLCGASFKSAKHLKVHSVIHSEASPYICTEPDCFKAFKTTDRLRIHSKLHAKHQYNCEICGETYAWSSTFKRHIEQHEKNLEISCKYCNEVFDTSHRMLAHRQTHTEHLPYVCEKEGCKKRFDTAKGLRQHGNRHLEQRRFKCEMCPVAFKLDKSLLKHIKKVHERSAGFPFQHRDEFSEAN